VSTASEDPVEILLVDDMPGNLAALEAILDDPSYTLVQVRSGEDALAQVLRHDFAVILLDVAMPGIDGFETARLIKQRERSSRIPIIFVTASVFDLEQVFRGYKIGAVDYLRKPLDPFAVRAKVSVFVELWRQQQQILRQERRARELEAYASEQRWATTLRSIGDAVIATDEAGRVTFVNPVAESLTGWMLDEARGRSIDEIFPIFDEETGARLESPVSAVIREGNTVTVMTSAELRGRKRSYAIEDSGAPVRDGDGRLLGAVLVFRDATERRRAEERRRFLAEATSRLLSSLDVSETMAQVVRLAVPKLADFCIVDLVDEETGEVQEVAAEHVHPEGVEQIRELRRRFPMPADSPVLRGIRRGESRLLQTITPEVLRAFASSEEHFASLQALEGRSAMLVPLQARGRVTGVLTLAWTRPDRAYGPADLEIARELAQRAAIAVDNARLYYDAQQAVRVRDEFLSVASHELRTPLTSLMLQLETLEKILRRTKAESKLLGKVGASVKMADRLASLVDRLLDVSRISTGRLQLQLDDLDLAELVRDVAERFRGEATRAGCRIEINSEPSSGRWDRLRIEQVITNLLSNAVKYGPGQPIEIRIAPTGAMARVSVRDHGIGITADAARRIFGRFERAVSVRHYGGLGLGLYVARQIAEAHGGTIRVESRPQGGALFVLELPREAHAEASAPVH
jgi:PAS domain S-box-containing protein